ncbi:unnamed protein product [Urochloa humidicola]
MPCKYFMGQSFVGYYPVQGSRRWSPIVQDLVIRHDAADSIAFTASAYGGAIRLRASGRRTLVADHHEHQLHIHLVAVQGGSRELRGNKSGSAAEFLAMGPDRRAGAVARVVARAGFPPGSAGGVARFCEVAARAARGKGCDDVTVTVDWTPTRAGAQRECGEEVEAGDDDDGAAAGMLELARGLYKYALGQFGFA